MKKDIRTKVFISASVLFVIFCLLCTVYIVFWRVLQNSVAVESSQEIQDDEYDSLELLQLELRQTHFPSNIQIDETFSQQEKSTIRNTIMSIRFPIEKLGKINITSGNSKDGNFGAYTTSEDYSWESTITINRDLLEESSFTKTISHEMGHVLQNRMFDLGRESKIIFTYKDIRNVDQEITWDTEKNSFDDWSSHYTEDLAEVFVKFYFDPEHELKSIYNQNVYDDDELIKFFNEELSLFTYIPDGKELDSGDQYSEELENNLRELLSDVFLPDETLDSQIIFWYSQDIYAQTKDQCVSIKAYLGNFVVSGHIDGYTYRICPISEVDDLEDGILGWSDVSYEEWRTKQKKKYVFIRDKNVYYMDFGQTHHIITDEDIPLIEESIRRLD